jgi:hypothetical protein
MDVETFGMARRQSWKAPMRRPQDDRKDAKAMRRRRDRNQRDLDAPACPREPSLPLSRLESRLTCPACGGRSITVVFEPPIHRRVGGG